MSLADDKRTPFLEFHTRFLYPFFFERSEVESASASLRQTPMLGGPKSVWEAGERDDLYVEETLPHVTRFLFPQNNFSGHCNYFQVDNDSLNRIFHDGLIFEIADENGVPKKLLVQRTGIELFLNEFGIGVLSINLKLDHENATLADSLAFNHLLVQPRQKFPRGLRRPHPHYDPEQFPNAEAAPLMKPPPDDGLPFVERIRARGGRFWLTELAQELLQPLKTAGLQPALRPELVQAQFWIYSVVRFDELETWNEAETRERLLPYLAGLAQVEEPGHAGAIIEDTNLPRTILNAKHWAAAGLMGTVHLMADQPRNHPFNTSRVGRAMRKYFVVYLMGLFQRLMLQRAMQEAGAIIKSDDSPGKLTALRQSLLEFGLGGHFGQVSTRHAVQQFSDVVENGLGITSAWQQVRQVIDDIDAKFTAEQSLKLASETKALAEGQKQATEGLLRLQATLHWMEAFIVSVYAAELWHLFAGDQDCLRPYLAPGVVIFAIAGFIAALLVLKPWQREE